MHIELPSVDPLAGLRCRWFAYAALALTSLVGGYMLMSNHWSPSYAARWLGPALILWGYLLVTLWRGLADNVRQRDGMLLPSLGPGNVLTLLRGSSLALLAGFLLLPRPSGSLAWAPGALFTLFAVADFFDGYLARVRDQATRLGEQLDLQLDGLGTLIASVLAVSYGQVPAWFLGIGMARYLFLAGIWLRERLGKPVHPLVESVARRAFAGVMMTFIAIMLWPLFSPPGTHLAASLFAIPFAVGFTRDWLVVSGVLSSSVAAPGETSTRGSSTGFSNPWSRLSPWVALILRLLVAGLTLYGVALLLAAWYGGSAGELPATSSLPDFWVPVGLQTLGALLIAFGAAGRVGALALLFGVGIQLRGSALSVELTLLIVGATVLFFLGTGAFSTWQPEEHLISTRMGEAKQIG